jgi:hypothetical protein
MSDTHDVPKMVAIYKRLFLVLILITAFGIGLAYLRLPVWPAIGLAVAIIIYKSGVVLSSFKHLLVGRYAIILSFALTFSFFLALLILPWWTHKEELRGTEDLSKRVQMDEIPAEGNHGH